MNKKIFFPGIALFAMLGFSCSLEAIPPLTKKQFETFIRVMRTTLREPKTMIGLGTTAGIIMIGFAAYKLIRRADTTVHHTGVLTANAAEMTNNIVLLLRNPVLLKNDELRRNLTEIFATIAERSVASYVRTSAAVEAETATTAGKAAPQPTIVQVLVAIANNSELKQFVQNTVESAIKTYAKAQLEAQAAQPPTNEPSAITQTIAALAANPHVVATATFNLAKGYVLAKNTEPVVTERPVPVQQPAESKPWFFTRWKDAIIGRYSFGSV